MAWRARDSARVSWYSRLMGDRDAHLKLTNGSPLVLLGAAARPDQVCPAVPHRQVPGR